MPTQLGARHVLALRGLVGDLAGRIRFISGAALKTLAAVDLSDFDVWEFVVGGKDELIGNKEFSDLDKHGVERFATKRFSATIIVNARA
ncbi:multiubiquitin domain-containing protein [Pseudomonas koreensis]|uniref:multiubiquitin domain-containing protein n=1 Tax=Pseudomonas koreensis TaxID=198620 RepID=UPI0038057438